MCRIHRPPGAVVKKMCSKGGRHCVASQYYPNGKGLSKSACKIDPHNEQATYISNPIHTVFHSVASRTALFPEWSVIHHRPWLAVGTIESYCTTVVRLVHLWSIKSLTDRCKSFRLKEMRTSFALFSFYCKSVYEDVCMHIDDSFLAHLEWNSEIKQKSAGRQCCSF